MADGSKIEWTDATWNPVRARLLSDPSRLGWYCVHASEGCRNCYAETMNQRGIGTGLPYKPGHRKDVEIFINDKQLKDPLRWKRPRKIFVCSMTDLFADFVPDEMIDQVFAIMALCPQHTFQVLTKRADRMRAWFESDRLYKPPVGLIAELYTEHPDIARLHPLTAQRALDMGRRGWPLPNVWLGVSVEDQQAANDRIPDLLTTPAAVRWLSCEPLLAPVDLCKISTLRFRGAEILDATTGTLEGMFGDPCSIRLPAIDWVVAGGESGPKARPMHPAWARTLRDQCGDTDVAFHFKQWGEWRPREDGDWQRKLQVATVMPRGGVREWHPNFPSERPTHPDMRPMVRVGKKAAGRLLDGVEHNGFPHVPERTIA